MKKFLSLVLVTVMILSMMASVTVFAAKEMFTTISAAAVSGVTEPIVGNKPSTTAVSDEPGKYTVAKVSWSEYTTDYDHVKDMGANDTFRAGYVYFVFINLEAKASCNFSTSMTQTINGKNANKYTPSDNGSKVQIYTSFASVAVIKNVNLTVVNPVVGKFPTFAKLDTTEYTSEKYGTVSNCSNGVTWTNQSSGVNITVSNVFKEDVKYKVTYYLTAKDGFKFTSDTACTINGSAATLTVTDEKHITVSLGNIIPGDGKKEITTLELSVTAPADGAKPSFDKIDGTGYYSDNGIHGVSTKIYKNGIAWYKSASSYISPGTTETFVGGTSYTVKISLMPKDGYKFGKSLSAKINGKTATVETFDDGSVDVSVVLTALSKEHKHTDSAWKNDAENHWKVCNDTSCGMITSSKEAHKDTNKDNKCDVCAYQLPVATPVPTAKPEETVPQSTAGNDSEIHATAEPTMPVITQKPETTEVNVPATEEPVPTDNIFVGNDADKDDSQKGNDNNDDSYMIWIIVGVAVFVTAGVVVAVVLIKKKK